MPKSSKRYITICLVFAISFMLIAHESNAFPLIPIGIAILTAISIYTGWKLHEKFGSKASTTNVIYSTSIDAYLNDWYNEQETINNMINTTETHANNLIEMLKGQKLFWMRIAERQVVNYLNYSEWNENIEKAVTKQFDYFIYNMTINAILWDYALILAELEHEVNNMANYDFDGCHNCKAEFRILACNDDGDNEDYLTLAGTYYNGEWVRRQCNITVVYGEKPTYTGFGYDIPHKITKVKDNVYFAVEDFENITDMDDWIFTNSIYVIYELKGASAYVLTKPDTMDEILEYQNFDYDYNYKQYDFLIVYENHTDFGLIELNFYKLHTWKEKLYGIYSVIKQNMITSAYTYWSYLKSQGYNDASEIPENMIPVLPDLVLDNLEALGNISEQDAFVIFYSILCQIDNYIYTDKIIADKLKIADYKGKIATITLIKYDNNATTLIFETPCYIIPYEHSLTLYANTDYLLTKGKIPDGISYDLTINQQIGIFDIENERFYNLYPSNSTQYLIKVYTLYKDGNVTNEIRLNILEMGEFTKAQWGFTFTGINEPIIILKTSEFATYLILFALSISLIIVGSISNKFSWLKVIGILIFLFTIGYIIYSKLLFLKSLLSPLIIRGVGGGNQCENC